MAEVEWAGARPPTRIERRIKVEVLHDEEVRRKVRGLINAAYREFPTEKYGHAVPWTVMKKAVADLLRDESAPKTPSPLSEARRQRDFLYAVAQRQPPSARMTERLKQADEEVEAQVAATKQKKTWWSYITTMAEELGRPPHLCLNFNHSGCLISIAERDFLPVSCVRD
jgi:hypothetical protein